MSFKIRKTSLIYSQGIISALGKLGRKKKTYKWKSVFNDY